MKETHRKIIAREGLVILSILACATIMLVISNQLSSEGHNYWSSKDIHEVEFTANTKASFSGKFYVPGTFDEVKLRTSEVLNLTSAEEAQTWIDNKYAHEIQRIRHQKTINALEDLSYGAFIFFLFAYPLYLIARFIRWAIPVVKQ